MLHLGGALPRNESRVLWAMEVDPCLDDIFVDGVEAVRPSRAAQPTDLPGEDRWPGRSVEGFPRRWLFALAGSVVIHLLLALMLFAPRPGWTRPEGKVNEGGQVIALSLVEMPGEETPAPKTARPAAAPVAPPKRREPRMTEAPKPSMAMAAKPVIKEPAEPAAFRSAAAPEAAATGPEPAPGSIFTAQGSGPANAPPTGADQAQVRASVPLYDRNPAPVYPAAARRRNLEGMVLLSVLVDCEGKAAEVKLQRGSGHALLDGSALDSVRRWRFTPALRGGRPQEMWVQVPVRFELK